MNQQKIQNEQSFNNRGHRKMWMFLLLTCTYLLQISSFRNQMTQKDKSRSNFAFFKSNAYHIQWDNIKHKSMKHLAFA